MNQRLHEILAILKECEFPGYWILARAGENNNCYLYAQYWEQDSRYQDGGEELQTTREWLVTPEQIKGQIVQTAFKCILTSKEHSTRENSHYRGKAIFGPHFDVDRLHEICEY